MEVLTLLKILIINNLLKIGADKVVLKSVALKNPRFIQEAVKIFGSQCIVVSVDVKSINNEYKVYHYENDINRSANDFIKEMEDLGAGELFINDVKNDGVISLHRVLNNSILYAKKSIYPLLRVEVLGNPNILQIY